MAVAAELPQEVQSDFALHSALHFPAGESARHSRAPPRRQPFFQVFHHVHRGCASEAREQRPRQRVAILDRPGGLVVRQPPADGFDSTSWSVSSPSSCVSSRISTSIVLEDSPAWKLSVPLVAV